MMTMMIIIITITIIIITTIINITMTLLICSGGCVWSFNKCNPFNCDIHLCRTADMLWRRVSSLNKFNPIYDHCYSFGIRTDLDLFTLCNFLFCNSLHPRMVTGPCFRILNLTHSHFMSFYDILCQIYILNWDILTVQAFATDCSCGIWCHGLTTRLLNVVPCFGNLVL